MASSDESIKFHEVWSETGKTVGDITQPGLLGGSKILEGLVDLEMGDGETIR